MVEFALTVSLLIVIVMGIIEFALAFKDDAAVSSSVRVGVRMAATGAGAGPALCGTPATTCSPARPALAQAAADAIETAGVAMPKDSIDWIMVYRVMPGDSGNPPGTSNPASTCTSNCVWFRWLDASDQFAFQGGSWNQSTINACLNAPDAQSVGVYMKATHSNLTGFFGGTFPLSDRAVMKFEPLPSQSCTGAGVANGGHA